MKNNLTKAIQIRVKQNECSIQKELQEQYEMQTFQRSLSRFQSTFEISDISHNSSYFQIDSKVY